MDETADEDGRDIGCQSHGDLENDEDEPGAEVDGVPTVVFGERSEQHGSNGEAKNVQAQCQGADFCRDAEGLFELGLTGGVATGAQAARMV